MLQDEFTCDGIAPAGKQYAIAASTITYMLTQIVDNNRKIIANGSIRSFEAVYRNAEIYEMFADRYANQERNQIWTHYQIRNQQAHQRRVSSLFEKAVEEYKDAVKNIPIIADKFGVDIFAEPDTSQTMLAEADTSMSGISRAAETDSTHEMALRWYNLSAGKISRCIMNRPL